MAKFFKALRLIVDSAPGRGLTSCVMLFSSFLAFISAFPTVEAYVRYGRNRGFVTLLFGAVIAYIWGNYIGLFGYVGVVGLMSILLGELVNKGITVPKILLYSGLLVLSVFIILGSYSYFYLAIDPVDFLASKIDTALTLVAVKYPEQIKSALLETGKTQKELSAYLAVKMPGVFLAGWMIFTFVNILFIASFNHKVGTFFLSHKLIKFKASDYLLVPTILFGGLYLYSVSLYKGPSLLETSTALVFLGFASIYFLQGLLITYIFVSNLFKSPFWSIMVTILLATIGYIFMAILGFFDSWFDFRKYFLKKEKKGDKK